MTSGSQAGSSTVTLLMTASPGNRRAPVHGIRMVLIVFLSVATTAPAWSAGSNTSAPIPIPTAPTPVTPSNTQTSNVSSATCAQQLSDAINDANSSGLALAAAGAAAQAASGLPPAVIAGAILTESAIAAQTAALVYTTAQTSVANSAHPTVGLPNCDATFAGTVAVTAGGVNVSGNSIFNNNVAVAGNFSVSGSLATSQLSTSQGISAFGGAITIGDPGLTTYSSGITLGGGALSGAGTGGLQAFTGDVSAIAIGNNARATQIASLALGLDASATGVSAIAIGQGSSSAATGSIALGQSANASAVNATAIGTGATVAVPFTNSTALGAGATATNNNQLVLGTANESISAPGINSSLSRSRQVGLLGVITSDSAGNLASDGGALYQQVATIKAGAAIAMALSDPFLSGSDQFGMKLNYGTYAGANAVGLSAAGVLARGLFNMKNQLVVTGAVGYGGASVNGYSQNLVGGHAGVQLTW
jgi:trimeric autotransporter adhesin